jgi:SMODS and SLOG-associating 2TM effector domain 3
MIEKDFPSYFQASDNASKQAQSNYINIIRIDLISMIVASAMTIYNYQQVESKLYVYVISGVLLLASLILTIVLKSKQYEDTWYQGRALAESCKTLTWRFVTCSEYFEENLTDIEAKERFIDRIKELSNEFKDLSKVYPHHQVHISYPI